MSPESGRSPLSDAAEHAQVLARVEAVIHFDAEFPDQVIRARHGSLRFTDVPEVGWYTLRDFASLHGDVEVSAVDLDATEPPMSFTLPNTAGEDGYYEALNWEPQADWADAIWLAARMAFVGPSGRWAVYGERDLAVWWSDLPFDSETIVAWELRRRPWAFTVDEALGLVGMAFIWTGIPPEWERAFRRNYTDLARDEDTHAHLPEVRPGDREP